MAFVECEKYTKDQSEQDTEIASLTKTINEQREEIAHLNKIIDAQREEIARNIGCCNTNTKSISDLSKTALKNIFVSAPISGDGTVANPVNLAIGSGLKTNELGVLEINLSAVANPNFLQALKDNGLLGGGLDVVDGKLTIKTTRIVDASGTTEVTLGVGK